MAANGHYRTAETLAKAEALHTGGHPHPWVPLSWGTQLLAESRTAEAVLQFYQSYQSISSAQAEYDPRAGYLWSLSLYYGWYAYEKLQKPRDAERLLNIVMNSTFYPATLACLQSSKVALATCLTDVRTSILCSAWQNPMVPRLPQVRPLRIDPCEHGPK